MNHHKNRPSTLSCLALMLFGVVGCRQQMADQPAYRPLEGSRFFGDGQSARPLVPGTVARGPLNGELQFFTGKDASEESGPNGGPPNDRSSDGGPSLDRASDYIDEFPSAITEATLRRGQERYNIYCAPCHAEDGSGRGTIVLHGYPEAATFHSERLRAAPIGYFFDVITRGRGKMPSYAGQVNPHDRWAIVGYVRALQKSRQAEITLPTAMKLIPEGISSRSDTGLESWPKQTIPTDAGSGRYVVPGKPIEP